MRKSLTERVADDLDQSTVSEEKALRFSHNRLTTAIQLCADDTLIGKQGENLPYELKNNWGRIHQEVGIGRDTIGEPYPLPTMGSEYNSHS